jgi:tRNA(Arg) A34 adenosine deaminase TadA
MTDKEFLQRAIDFAEKSPEDVKCACLLVRDGKVLTAQFNSQHRDKIAINHAEIKAIVALNYELRTRELERFTAYCSCEPCAMCLAALSYAKVERIIYAKSMAEMFPDDPQAKFDSQAFVTGLNFVPKLEQIKL